MAPRFWQAAPSVDLSAGKIAFRPLGTAQAKGRVQALEVFEVVGLGSAAGALPQPVAATPG